MRPRSKQVFRYEIRRNTKYKNIHVINLQQLKKNIMKLTPHTPPPPSPFVMAPVNITATLTLTDPSWPGQHILPPLNVIRKIHYFLQQLFSNQVQCSAFHLKQTFITLLESFMYLLTGFNSSIRSLYYVIIVCEEGVPPKNQVWIEQKYFVTP